MTKIVTWVGGPEDGQELTIPDDKATYITIAVYGSTEGFVSSEPLDPISEVPFRTVICEIKGNKVYYPYDKINKFD